jgi:hypothetical protein
LQLAFETKALRAICEDEAQAELKLAAKVAEITAYRGGSLEK